MLKTFRLPWLFYAGNYSYLLSVNKKIFSDMKLSFTLLNLLQSLALLAVIYVNFLANSLPINGMTTGEISAFYPNYFVPAGITFSIWGLIYILLLMYVFQSWFLSPEKAPAIKTDRYIWFVVSSAGNAGWIFAWHYRLEWLSMALMLLLLYSLIRLYLVTRADRWALRVPVSIYLGWITVATIANATALLVHLGFTGGFLSEPAWAILLMTIAVIISLLIRIRFVDPFYHGVVIWAILGIYLKYAGSSQPSASTMQWAALILTGVLLAGLLAPVFLKRSHSAVR